MTDIAGLVKRLRLIADWHTPGRSIPKKKCPEKEPTCREAADALERLAALEKRVADAPIHSFRFDFDTGIVSVSTMFPEDYAGKRVRLLLEDET